MYFLSVISIFIYIHVNTHTHCPPTNTRTFENDFSHDSTNVIPPRHLAAAFSKYSACFLATIHRYRYPLTPNFTTTCYYTHWANFGNGSVVSLFTICSIIKYILSSFLPLHCRARVCVCMFLQCRLAELYFNGIIIKGHLHIQSIFNLVVCSCGFSYTKMTSFLSPRRTLQFQKACF